MLKILKQSNFQAVSRYDYEQSLSIIVESINTLMKDVEDLKIFLQKSTPPDTSRFATKEEVKQIFKIIDKNLCSKKKSSTKSPKRK